MRPIRWIACVPIGLSLCVAAVRAETPKAASGRLRDPARLLSEQTDLLVRVSQPRRLVETLTTLDSLKQLQQFAPVRELFDSTNYRRFHQLVAYFEKELGVPWPQLLDRLGAGGAVVGVQIGANPAPALLVLQGEDEKLTHKFFQVGSNLVEQELARQEGKDKLVKGVYEGIETVRIGSEFHAAVAGSTLFLSNNDKALRGGLDRYLGRVKKSMADVSGVAEAAKLLPPEPLVSFWLNMESVRKVPELKALYAGLPRDDPNLTVLFGHYLDLLGRSPFVCGGVYHEKAGFLTTIRIPRGRDGMGADQLLHVPPAGAPGSRPLLEPKNVLFSESGFLDLANIWNSRTKLFNEKQAKALEKFDKQGVPLLTAVKVSKLLTQTAPYYRFVAAHQPKVSYKTTPKISIPAFALVWELREPEAFDKAMGGLLRAGALLGGAQVNLKLVEEKRKDCAIVGYRFSETTPLKGDVNDLRFNFSPCFTRVGDQFVWCSTIELCRELVDILRKEGEKPPTGDASAGRSRLYASGAAAYLHTIEDLLVTQATLDRALAPKEAREEIAKFLDLVRGFGALSIEPRFNGATFQFDIRLQPEK